MKRSNRSKTKNLLFSFNNTILVCRAFQIHRVYLKSQYKSNKDDSSSKTWNNNVLTQDFEFLRKLILKFYVYGIFKLKKLFRFISRLNSFLSKKSYKMRIVENLNFYFISKQKNNIPIIYIFLLVSLFVFVNRISDYVELECEYETILSLDHCKLSTIFFLIAIFISLRRFRLH